MDAPEKNEEGQKQFLVTKASISRKRRKDYLQTKKANNNNKKPSSSINESARKPLSDIINFNHDNEHISTSVSLNYYTQGSTPTILKQPLTNNLQTPLLCPITPSPFHISAIHVTGTECSSSSAGGIHFQKCKFTSKLTKNNRIHVFNIQTVDDPVVEVIKTFNGVSSAYVDHGNPTHICRSCRAMLWESEMLRGNRNQKNTSYSLCCKKGAIQLPRDVDPPALLLHLYTSKNTRSINFLNNIRAYNMMFSFTSMGGKVDKSLQNGRGPYVFRLQGQNFHRIGSLLPDDGASPKFSQLYIYDSENEIANRVNAVSSSSGSKTNGRKDALDSDVITIIKNILDSCNPLVKSFRMARDCLKEQDMQNVSLKLIAKRNTDGRTYNLPSTSEVAALIVGDVDNLVDNRDIILRTTSGNLQRISELHPSYLPLQYPLLFPYGQDCFRLGIKHKGIEEDSELARTDLTMREFFCYHLQDRPNQFSLVLNARKLLHQFLVDAYTMVESDRLWYIKTQQKNFAQTLSKV